MQQIDCVCVSLCLFLVDFSNWPQVRFDTEPEPVAFHLGSAYSVVVFIYLYFSKVNHLHLLAFILFSVGTHTKSEYKLNSHRVYAFLMRELPLVLSERVPRTCRWLQYRPPAARESRASTIYYIAVPITMIYLSPICRARAIERARFKCLVAGGRCRRVSRVSCSVGTVVRLVITATNPPLNSYNV